MRAMAVTAYGAPLQKVEVPEPDLLPGHALVEVLTCGVCFSDVKTSQGLMPYSDRLQLPHVPGHEICARVLETDPPRVIDAGTKVVVYHVWPCRMCARCRAGEDNLCTDPRGWTGFTHPGGFQDRLVVPLDRVVSVPDSIDEVHAAPLTCALGTAYRAVVTRGGVRPGARAVVIGLGGVGIHALQVATAAGAAAVGLDVSQAAIDAARELGLEAHRQDEPDAVARLVPTTDEGVDVVIDTVGHSATIHQAERLVRPGGRIVAVGYSVMEEFALPAARLVLEEVHLLGSRYVRLAELERAIAMVASGRIRTVVSAVKPLEQANDAFQSLIDGRIVGRVVLDVAGVA